MNTKEIVEASTDDLCRKALQHWEMAGLARMDRDEVDAARHTKIARKIDEELRRRRTR